MVRVAVGIIMDTSGRVLLCQRLKNKPYPLKWEFPGGKVEDEEDVRGCLRRELREELGINATIGELYHRSHYTYPDSGTFDVFYYLIQSFTGALRNKAFKDIQWVRIDELIWCDILEGNRDVVKKLVSSNANVVSR